MMLCMVLFGTTATLQAQDHQQRQKPTTEDVVTKRTDKLAEALKLDANQKKQVHALMLEKHQQKEKINNTKLTQDERNAQMKELHQNFDAKLKALLNPEQAKQYEAKKAEMKNKHGHHCDKGGQHKHKGPHPKDGPKK